MITKIDIEKYLRRKDSGDAEISGLPLVALIENTQSATKQHTHRFSELVIILSGTGQHQCNGRQTLLSRGDCFIIPQGSSHCYKDTENLKLVNVLFDLKRLPVPFMDMYLLPGFYKLFPGKSDTAVQTGVLPGFHMTETLTTELEPLLYSMAQECSEFAPGRDFRLLSAFMMIIGKLISNYPEPASTGAELLPVYQLSSVIGFLNREFRNKISFADILKKIPMSHSTLNRNFVRAFGMTPMRYLNKLRLDHASLLLTSTALSISEIAEKSGFSDSNYFTRVFRLHNGITPSLWRSKNR